MIDTKALREKILDLAMRGKLVPQDPNDEPASELLKRIKAEKEELIKQKKIKRDKNETEIFRGEDGSHYEKNASGEVKPVEVPFEIPDGWEWVNLVEICNYIQRGKSPKYGLVGIPVISQKSIQWTGFDISPSKFLDEESFKKYDKIRLLLPEDILWNSTGTGTIGRVLKLKETDFHLNPILVADSHVTVVRTFSNINSDFVNYYLSSKTIQNLIEDMSSGSTNQIELSATQVKSTKIPLPPIKEQEKIVRAIDELLKIVNTIEQEQKALQDLSNQLKQKVLTVAMQGKLVPQDPNDEPASVLLEKIRAEKQRLFEEGKLKKKDLEEIPVSKEDNAHYGKLPNGWIKVALNEVGSWKSGTTPRKDKKAYYSNGSIPWLLTGDLNDDYISLIPNKITEVALKETSLKINPIGSVLIAMYGATIGKLGILELPATTNQACCACKTFSLIENEYLFFWLMANRKGFIDKAEGGAQLNISKAKIISTFISLPSIYEQQRIIKKIRSVFLKIAQLKE